MKPKTIIILFIIAHAVGMIGVFLFSTNHKDIGRLIMVIGIISQVSWVIGLCVLLYKKYMKS